MNTNAERVADEAIAVLSDEVLAGLGRDTAEVRGLPNEAFTTQAFLSLEYRTLFKRSWVFAGRASAIAAPGDVEPVDVGGELAVHGAGRRSEDSRVLQRVPA